MIAGLSSSTSEEEAQPSVRAIQQAVRVLREDVDDLQDSHRASQRQALWLLHSQVKRDRAEASCQLVIQGFEPWKEAADALTAFRNRDTWCLDLCSRLSGVHKDLIKLSCSHGTSAERLSRLSILTLQNASLASAIARAAGTQKHIYQGTTAVTVRRQNCTYDRLCSAPIKVVMECLSKEAPQLRNAFRPDWKARLSWDTSGTLIGNWRINVQKARIRIHVQEPFVPAVREAMGPGLARLQFGAAAAEGEGGGDFGHHAQDKGQKGKAKGRGKANRYLQPTEPGMFKYAPPQHRQSLGSLQMAGYQFEVSVRSLKPVF